MKDRIFRLMERHQKIDESLRLAQTRRIPDPLEIGRLRRLKQAMRGRLANLVRSPLAV